MSLGFCLQSCFPLAFLTTFLPEEPAELEASLEVAEQGVAVSVWLLFTLLLEVERHVDLIEDDSTPPDEIGDEAIPDISKLPLDDDDVEFCSAFGFLLLCGAGFGRGGGGWFSVTLTSCASFAS